MAPSLKTKTWLGWMVLPSLAVTVPFVLWSPTAFYHSVLRVPFLHPFRDDAMTLLAYWHQQGGAALSAAWGFFALAVMSCVAMRRLPATSQGTAYGVGLLTLWFVACNRQGFCNYYFIVIVSMSAAAALAPREKALTA